MNKLLLWKSSIGALGLAAGSTGHHFVSLVCLILLLVPIYKSLQLQFDNLFSIGLMVFLWISISVSIYLFGQFVTPLPHILIRAIVFVLLVFGNYPKDVAAVNTCSILKQTTTLIFGCLLLNQFLHVSINRLITFLGFGYDNYAHLLTFRTILINRQTIFGLSESHQILNLLGSSPIGTHSAFALIAETIGINGSDVSQSLQFFAAVTLLMPVFAVLVSVLILIRGNPSIRRRVIGSLLILTVILWSYISHMWFSGYFTSNFATILMLVGIGVALSSRRSQARLFLLALLCGIMFVVYPMYSALLLTIVFLVFFIHYSETIESFKKLPRRHLLCSCLLLMYMGFLDTVALFGALSYLPNAGFLSLGGIAPLPVGTTMFVFGITSLLLIQSNTNRSLATALIAQTLVAIAVGGMVYAHYMLNVPGELWLIPYYPTKLATTVLLVVLVLLIDHVIVRTEFSNNHLVVSIQQIFLLTVGIGSLVLSSYNSWPFSQGYMGTTSGVIKSMRANTDEVVDGDLIIDWKEASKLSDKPVLILSATQESELNTRWVNSMLFNWSQTTWDRWRAARTQIDLEEYREASSIVLDQFLLITNQNEIINSLIKENPSLKLCTSLFTITSSCDIFEYGQ